MSGETTFGPLRNDEVTESPLQMVRVSTKTRVRSDVNICSRTFSNMIEINLPGRMSPVRLRTPDPQKSSNYLGFRRFSASTSHAIGSFNYDVARDALGFPRSVRQAERDV